MPQEGVINRRAQNQALRDFEQLKRLVAALDPIVTPVLLKASFGTGVRKAKSTPRDRERGTPPPDYADPTGEVAVAEEVRDRVATAITAITKHVTEAVNLARWVQEDVPNTNSEAIKREIPNCQACDRAVFGRVKSGYCQECYDRKRYLQVADRAEFRKLRLAELVVQDEIEAEQRAAHVDPTQTGVDLRKGKRR